MIYSCCRSWYTYCTELTLCFRWVFGSTKTKQAKQASMLFNSLFFNPGMLNPGCKAPPLHCWASQVQYSTYSTSSWWNDGGMIQLASLLFLNLPHSIIIIYCAVDVNLCSTTHRRQTPELWCLIDTTHMYCTYSTLHHCYSGDNHHHHHHHSSCSITSPIPPWLLSIKSSWTFAHPPAASLLSFSPLAYLPTYLVLECQWRNLKHLELLVILQLTRPSHL